MEMNAINWIQMEFYYVIYSKKGKDKKGYWITLKMILNIFLVLYTKSKHHYCVLSWNLTTPPTPPPRLWVLWSCTLGGAETSCSAFSWLFAVLKNSLSVTLRPNVREKLHCANCICQRVGSCFNYWTCLYLKTNKQLTKRSREECINVYLLRTCPSASY